jgi:hypothetical protein
MMAQTQRNSFGALLLIGLGVLFLVGQVFNINFWSIVGFSWPVLVMIPGLIFLALAFSGDRRAAGFAFPGSIITGTGAILWYQNMTGNWQSWAYMWTLYPAFVGLAMMFNGRRQANDKLYGTGRSMANYSAVAFVAAAAFFELLIFHANGALTGWIVPLGLIGAGGYLLLGGRSHFAAFATPEKRKPDVSAFAGARGSGRISHGDELQRQIDEALREDAPVKPGDPQEPKPLV